LFSETCRMPYYETVPQKSTYQMRLIVLHLKG
jgi:hypothetical protein